MTARDRDPTAHTITHMTSHKSTRSRRSDILAHHRSSQRAAISTPERRPARRPSHHGYVIRITDVVDELLPIVVRHDLAACERDIAHGRGSIESGVCAGEALGLILLRLS